MLGVSRHAWAFCLVAWLGVALWQANPVRVGDGHEHVAVALALARGQGPAFAPDQIPSLEAELRALGPSFANATLAHPDLVGRDGRQDLPHFWLYPLLAAPAVKVALLLGVSPLWGFVGLARAAARGAVRARPRTARPGLDVVAAAEPPRVVDRQAITRHVARELPGRRDAAVDDPSDGVADPARRRCQPEPGAGAGRGAVCRVGLDRAARAPDVPPLADRASSAPPCSSRCLPAYYLWRLGIPSPLTAATITRWPGLFDALFPFSDVSVGLVVRYPPFVVAVLVAATWLAWRELSRLREPFIATTGLAALALLWVVGQPVSQNHGGSPDLSRYALWLMPLALPLLQQAGTSTSRVMPAPASRLAMLSAALDAGGVPAVTARGPPAADAVRALAVDPASDVERPASRGLRRTRVARRTGRRSHGDAGVPEGAALRGPVAGALPAAGHATRRVLRYATVLLRESHRARAPATCSWWSRYGQACRWCRPTRPGRGPRQR